MNSNSIHAPSVNYIRKGKRMMEARRDIRWRLRPTLGGARAGATPAGAASATAAGAGSAIATSARVGSFEVDVLEAAGEGTSEGGAAATAPAPAPATAREWHADQRLGLSFVGAWEGKRESTARNVCLNYFLLRKISK
jgi:hypothetical protein